jgi:hypothetical protein
MVLSKGSVFQKPSLVLCGYLSFASERFSEHEPTVGTATDVFDVFTEVMRLGHGLCRSLVSKHLRWFLILAENRIRLIIGVFKHLPPWGDEIRVLF